MKKVLITGSAICPKFNIVGAQEFNNLFLAQIISDAQNKKLNYNFVDLHSSRLGHNFRYLLSSEK